MKPARRTLLALALALPAVAQEPPDAFAVAAADAAARLEQAVAELDALRRQVADEQVPLSRRLTALEAELVAARAEAQQVTRLLDSRSLDLTNLGGEIKSREEETAYLSNLLGEYQRNFASRLHIAEVQRHESELEQARLAAENTALPPEQVFAAQARVLELSLGRLEEALGGTRFEGTAVDPSGRVLDGTFAMLGPAALFRSRDGSQVGAAEQRLGSLEPAIIPFGSPDDARAAGELVASGRGTFPLDPSLGNAQKIEATQETLWEHILAGGAVMLPIFLLAGAALLVVIYKWITVSRVKSVPPAKVAPVLQAVARGDREGAVREARALGGPTGRMLAVGAEHLGEPRELIEEVMYADLLGTRLGLQRMLPFVAISASAAPLLGLLGTVTGIMNTFKLITVFGTGDVKTLSSGISEALITTEWGLYVAIPALISQALLNRKVKSILGAMEQLSVSFINGVPEPVDNPFNR